MRTVGTQAVTPCQNGGKLDRGSTARYVRVAVTGSGDVVYRIIAEVPRVASCHPFAVYQ